MKYKVGDRVVYTHSEDSIFYMQSGVILSSTTHPKYNQYNLKAEMVPAHRVQFDNRHHFKNYTVRNIGDLLYEFCLEPEGESDLSDLL